MHVSKLITFVLVLSSNFILAQADSIKTKEHLKALEALQKKDTTSAITLFQESIKQNDDELSSFELARIYSTNSRFQNFFKAYICIKKALNENEKNIEYKLLKAFLLEEIFYSDPLCKTYRNDAISLYEDIVKEDEKCEHAWFNIGRLNKEDYLKYMNSEYFSDLEDRKGEPAPEYIYSPVAKFKRGLKGSTLRGETYDKFRASLPKPILKYTRIANQMFSKAGESFLKSIELTKSEKSFIELTELYILGKNYDKGLDLLKRFVNPNIEPSKYYLVNGMANYLAGNIELSEREFKKAFELMTKEERDLYTNFSFKKLLKPKTADSLSTKDKVFVENYFYKYMQDHDPLILTNYSERLLEHFTRVTYSNLMFSVKRLNLTGWNTDRGEVVIRYGIPDQITRMRSSIYISPMGGLQRELTETEIFYYPDKTFSFYDIMRRGRYVFNDPTSDGIRVSQSRESTVDSIVVYREKKPEEYVPKLQGPIFYTPFAIYQFPSKSLTKTDIYISFLINPKDSSTQKDFFDNGYTTGIYLFDKNHNKTTEKVSDFPPLYSNTKLTINSLMFNSVPREGSIAFEILRKKDNGAFTYHDLFKVKRFSGTDLSMSDLVLCFDVGQKEFSSYIKRNDLYFLPNPSNYFTGQMQMFIYYEINNLSLNTNNATDFEQKITIQKKEEGGVLNSLLSVVGLDKEGKKISLTSKYQTQERDPQMYLQLDMTRYEPGEYVITVTIKDIITGKEVSNQTEINWQ
ncbi:MAG: GWxTD domain-containing protein [Ignavibacteriales bacterium]|nr:GWxTD domain-containing protein [Ignavibacteriales bacterium]